jgi:hypothetical protein
MNHVPTELLSQFEWLRQDVAWLAQKWELFSELFWLYPKRHQLYLQSDDLMWCFRWIFEALHDDIVMALCRLTDPASDGDHQNLTLRRMLDHPALAGDWRLRRRLKTVRKHVGKVRRHRNRRVAHCDLQTRLGSRSLPKIGRTLRKAVNSTLALTDAIELELTGNCTLRVSSGRQAACELLSRLRIAARCEKKAWHEAAR